MSAIVFAVILPIILICGAASAAAILAYGTDPRLAHFAHGVQYIMLARRLEWPLIIFCLLLCVGLIALIISGRRRVWWLLGLAIVLALFVRAFSSSFRPAIVTVESPPFTESNHAVIGDPQQWVAGFHFGGRYYALPFQQMSTHPLILLTDQEDRVVVIWSVTANAATVLPIDRTVYPRDWEVVSTPADSLLLYDRRLGQFIVGVTGKTVKGQRPFGAGELLATEVLTYQQWTAEHPDTLVMALDASPSAPTVPVQSVATTSTDLQSKRIVAVLATTPPAAVPTEAVIGNFKNVTVGKTSVLLVRTGADPTLRAFDRQTRDDLFLTMRSLRRPDKKHPTATMIDSDSNSLWTDDGRAIDGPLKGTQLRPIAVRDCLYWGVMKFWMPELQWIEPK